MQGSKVRKVAVTAAAVLAAVTLAACSSSSSSSSTKTTQVSLKTAYNNTGKTDSSATTNGTLKVAEPNDSPFEGISDPVLSTNQEDADVFSPSGGQPGNQDGLFNTNKDYKIINGG
ncbi:MAG: oligopeptide ABC transporter substrate-binding protein, partial [Liquorilactobacillus nagelii]